MKSIVLRSVLVTTFVLFMTACGGGGTPPADVGNIEPIVENNETNISITEEKSPGESLAVESAQMLDVQKIIDDTQMLTADNYKPTAATLVSEMNIDTTPNLKEMFEHNTTTQAKSYGRSEKRTIREYQCPNGGTIKVDLDLVDRGFGADTHMTGDVSKYIYDRCKTQDATFDGTTSLRVNEFKEFDFSLVGEGDPMGKFTTDYDFLTLSTTETELVIDGALVYEAAASYKALDATPPTSLYKKHSTNGWKISSIDTQTGSKSTIEFEGLLEKIEYRHKAGTANDFTFCKTADFTMIFGDENGVISTLHIETVDAICGDVVSTSSGLLLEPTSGQVKMTIDEKMVILITYLADGRVSYSYDEDGDGTPDDSSEPTQFTYTNIEGFNIVENAYINNTGTIDLREYVFPSESVNKQFRTIRKNFFTDEEYEKLEGEIITVNINDITIKTQLNTEEREEYKINDKNITFVDYVKDVNGQIVKERDVTIGRLYDVGSTLYEYTVTGESKDDSIIYSPDITATCTLDEKLTGFNHPHPRAISHSGDIIRIKCEIKGTSTVTEISSGDKKTFSMNDVNYEYMQKGVGLIAEIDDNCIREGSFFSNETEGCSINDYEYKFFEKEVTIP